MTFSVMTKVPKSGLKESVLDSPKDNSLKDDSLKDDSLKDDSLKDNFFRSQISSKSNIYG
jgi:hypothetical protein